MMPREPFQLTPYHRWTEETDLVWRVLDFLRLNCINAFGASHRWVASGFLGDRGLAYASDSSGHTSSYDTGASSMRTLDSGDTVSTFDLNELD